MTPENSFDTHGYVVRQMLRFEKHEKQLEKKRRREEKKSQAIRSGIHEIEEATAFNAGLTVQESDAVFQTYGLQAPAILEVLRQNKAATPEEAYRQIDTDVIETHIDQENKVLNIPRWWSSYWGGRMFQKEDRHNHPRKYIGKHIVGAMAHHFFNKQSPK